MADIDSIKYTDIKDMNKEEKAKIDEFDKGPWKHLQIDKLIQSPPANSSKLTEHELRVLSGLPEDEQYILRYDDIFQAFKSYYEEIGADFPSKKVEAGIVETAPVILKLKYLYDRPRPAQLAPIYKINLGKVYELSSMLTPSYPSGHSTQGYYIASSLINDGGPQSLMKVAQNISRSRNIARAHYSSDSAAGRDLANILLKNKKSA